MERSITEGALADFGPPRKRKRGGGPKSAEGKGNSSQNARKHGCRSKRKILPGEQRADYDALWDEWLEQYEPESPADLSQLERLVDGVWRLRRSEAAYTDVERALRSHSTDAAEWPDDLVHRLQLMQRYRTTAENTFHKELRALEFLKARRDAERRERERQAEAERQERQRREQVAPEAAARLRKMEAERDAQIAAARQVPTAAQLLFRGQKCRAVQRRKKVWLRQWVEVRVVAGRTVTELSPSNEELIAVGQGMLPRPGFVLRRLNFPDGLPAEYDWVVGGAPDAERRRRGGSGVQRMSTDAWLALIESEAAEGDGHSLPLSAGADVSVDLRRGVGREAVGCGCPVCVKNVEILLKMQAEEDEGG